MKTSIKGGLWFGAIILISFIIGDFMMKAAFFGCLMLAGLVALMNSMPKFGKFMARVSKVIDVLIFLFTIIATAQFGLNITAALTVAGLGYTLWYAPHLREKYAPRSNKKRIANYRNYYDCR